MIRAIALSTVLAIAAPPAQAQPAPPKPSPYERCRASARDNAAVVVCIDAETRRRSVDIDRDYRAGEKAAREVQASPDGDESLATLRASQATWAAFRDADCAARVRGISGEAAALLARECRLAHTADRADDLGNLFGPQPPPPPESEAAKPSVPPPPTDDYERCQASWLGRTMMGLQQCMNAELARQDARLNRAYKAAMEASSDPGDQDALRKAQRAWISFRDANCGLFGDQAMWGADGRYWGGDCLVGATAQRADALERLRQAR